jgi:hypothetical protein
VLLVLDDMSSSGDSLKALLHTQSLSPDSCVIVTSRQGQFLLQQCGVPEALLVEREVLSEEDAMALFAQHAQPKTSDAELQKGVVSACGGLPLTLEVMQIIAIIIVSSACKYQCIHCMHTLHALLLHLMWFPTDMYGSRCV